MLNRNHYRTLANALMIIFIMFVVLDLVGLPIIQRVRVFYSSKLAEGRLGSLRADMTTDEVKVTLGFPIHFGVTFGSGSSGHHMAWIDLGCGHHLVIVRNEAFNPPKLISVSVDDKSWKPQNDSTHQ
jgi:hypothetical protein